MKKLFVSVLAIASMVACMNEETVRVQDPAAIGFEANWVENATRANEAVDPSTTTASLTGFDVWGYMENTSGVIFTGENVTSSQGNFTYNNTAYWNPGHNYYFSALAPMDSTNAVVTPVASGQVPAGLGVVEFTNVKGAEDLLYAFAVVENAAADQAPVAFTFKHLLSKVKFSFTNGFTNPNNTIDVKNVKMTVPAEGSIDLNAGYVWENLNGALTLEFGDACAKTAVTVKQEAANERLTIPADAEQEYVISFDVVLYNGGVEAYKGTKTSTVTGVALEMGKAYNFAATLNAENFTAEGEELLPIEFDVAEVEDWVEAGDVAMDATTVADAASLKTAVANGGDIRLTENITLSDDELNVATGKNVNLDLNGKTLTVSALDPIENKGKMTIANGKVVANYGEDTRRCIYNYGEMTINGVEFVQTYDKKGAAINNAGKMIINDATVDAVYYSIWNAGAYAELTINGGNYTTTNNVALRDTWAYTVTCLNGAKMTINGGSFVGNHGVIAAEGGEVVLNGGTYHCTATYTGNSDWTLYAADGGSIRYNAAACTVTSANPSGATYGNVTTF